MKSVKKNVLKDMEKLQEKRILSKEAKDKITARVVANWAICISIAILIMTFVMASELLEKNAAIFVYNVYAMVFLICSIIILEVAYKKDNASWAISGLEVLILAMFTLFAPYVFFRVDRKYVYILIIIVTLYYIVKIIKISLSEKKKYLLEISDISDIIKKESQDELAQKFKNDKAKKSKTMTKKNKTKKKTTKKTANKKTTTKKENK